MKTIKYSITILILLSFSNLINAQVDAVAIHHHGNFLNPGDTVFMSVAEHYGTIQWQSSDDGINWTNIQGESGPTYSEIIHENKHFRAEIRDGECEPYYSEVLKVHTIQLFDNVRIIDNYDVELLSDSTELEDGIYKYLWDAENEIIDIGDVIVGSDGMGYMRKVISANYQDSFLILNTEQALIEDIIIELDLIDSLQIIIGDYDKAYVNGRMVDVQIIHSIPGVNIKSKGPGISLDNTVLYDSQHASAIITNGKIDFNPIFRRALKVSWGTWKPQLDHFKLSVGGRLDFDCDLELKSSQAVSFGEELRIIGMLIPAFQIGPIPVLVHLDFYVGFEAGMDFSGTMHSGCESSAWLEVGAEYESGWNNIWEKGADFDPYLQWSSTANANARAYVRPEVGLTIAGVAGPYINVETYLKAEANVTYPQYDWNWALKGGLAANLGFRIRFFSFDLVDYSYNLATWETTFASNSGTLENPPPYADFDLDYSFDHNDNDYVVYLTDKSANNPNSWKWEFDNGKTSREQNPIHSYTRPGRYNITLIATNCYGSHSITKSFFVGPCFGIETVEDIDGNIYGTAQIGNQCWLNQNLKVTRYRNGDNIANIEDNPIWGSTTNPAYSWYENNEAANKNLFGALYNFKAVNSGDLCPEGWVVASHQDWTELKNYLVSNSANKLREKYNIYWWGDNSNSTNETNFTARAAGYRSSTGDFLNIRKVAQWWTSNEIVASLANSRTIWYHSNDFDYTMSSNTKNGYSVRCIKTGGAIPLPPRVETKAAEEITQSSAIISGIVHDGGGVTVTQRGFVWSSTDKYPNLTQNDGSVVVGSGTGNFSYAINGFEPQSVYYFRAYAINQTGTEYGESLGFTAIDEIQPCPDLPIITDAEGNEYTTIQIGKQCWMGQNLKTTKLNNLNPIATGLNNTDWSSTGEAAYSVYPHQFVSGIDSEQEITEKFGLLYNWFAVNTENICPEGWYVPDNNDWQILEKYLGINISYKLSDTANQYWESVNYATDLAGFSARGAGERNSNGEYSGIKTMANFWTSDYCGINSAISRNINLGVHDFDSNISNSKNKAYSVRCIRKKQSQPVLPVEITAELSDITLNSVICGVSITDNGFCEIEQKGLVWSTEPQPDLDNNESFMEFGPVQNSFQAEITDLLPFTTYYVRAFATNSAGTAYGVQRAFVTTDEFSPCPGAPFVEDIDGNIYPTVLIGNQCWMAVNLRTSRYKDNSIIENGQNAQNWSVANTGMLSVYPHTLIEGSDSEQEVLQTYGYLYNWFAINSGNLCPEGWHVSTDAEWQILNAYIGVNVANELRTTGTDYWASPNANATNQYGFSAKGAGYRTSNGEFLNIKNTGNWWTSSDYIQGQAFKRTIWYHSDEIDVSNTAHKNKGFSVRCVRDF